MPDESPELLMQRFRESAAVDVMTSLLRSQDSEVHLALMAAHLGQGETIDGPELIALIGADLVSFQRMHPAAEQGAEDSPMDVDAESLLKRWREKRWVYRSIDPDTETEYYQLTSGAMQAVAYMRSLGRSTTVATDSAVEMIAAQLAKVADDANPDPQARRAAIDDQIAELVRQRDAIDRGEAPPPADHASLVHTVEALCQLVERMPADIVRYGEELREATAKLWDRNTTGAEAFGESLRWMLEEYQTIANSPAGKTYQSFYLLVGRREKRLELESSIDRVLQEVSGLPGHTRRALTEFVGTMRDRSREVESKKGTAYRRISRFVHSGDATRYQSVRARLAELHEAARSAVEHLHGGRNFGFDITMGPAAAESIGRWRLNDGTRRVPSPIVDTTNDYPADLPSEVGLEHIDEARLRAAVAEVVEAHGYATLSQVIDRLPEARTGDVFMLWSYASDHGNVEEGRETRVIVRTRRGARAIRMPELLFDKPIPEPPKKDRLRRTIENQPTLLEGIGHE